MRGGVSLAAALAIPLTTDAGEPFPERNLILFLTFAVIFGTLVVQGLTLPAVIRLLRLEDDGEAEGRELAQARIQAAEAALARLEELTGEDWVREDTATRIRGGYTFRQNRFAAWLDGGDDDSIEARSRDFQRLRRELLAAERAAVHELRRAGAISDDVARRVERDLDLEDAGWRSSGASTAISSRNAANAGFRSPEAETRPDCHRSGSGSSRRRNQSSMSIRGWARASANAWARYAAWRSQGTPKMLSGGLVW